MSCTYFRWIGVKKASTTWRTHSKSYSSEFKGHEFCINKYISRKHCIQKKKYIVILTEHLICNYSEDFTRMQSFNPQNYPLKQTLLVFPFCR